MSKHKQSSFILASASPRRKTLLLEAGYDFEVIISNVDESISEDTDISPTEFATNLAFAKALDVAKKYPDKLVLGADTIVDFEGEIIGKAADAEHAEEITRKLFSKPHKVITAVALIRLCDNVKIIKYDTTVVYPRQMTTVQIAEHIAGNSWQGKAGAYAIQETGDDFVEKIEGSLTNVMGLPMEIINALLPDLIHHQGN